MCTERSKKILQHPICAGRTGRAAVLVAGRCFGGGVGSFDKPRILRRPVAERSIRGMSICGTASGAKRSNRRDVDVSSVPNLKAISFVRELAFQKPASMFRSFD